MSKKPGILDEKWNQNPDAAAWAWTPDALTQFSQTLLIAQTPEDVLQASLDVITPTGVSGVTILLSGGPPEDRYLEIAAAWKQNGQVTCPIGARFSINEYLFQPLLDTGQPVVVDDLANDERVSESLRSALTQTKIATLVALPLGSEHDCFGAMLIDRSEAKPFNPENILVYKAVATLATGAIEKLWLIQETKHRLDKTLALYEISRHFSECQNVNDVLLTILDSKLFGAAGGTIALLEPSATSLTEQELVFQAAAGAGAGDILGMRMSPTEGVVGWVVRENEVAVIPDAYADERFYRQMDIDIEFRTHSILCAPLRVKGRVIGAIELVDVHAEYLSEEGSRLLDQVAQQIAPLIENQQLLTETQRHAQDLSRLLETGQNLTSTLDREQALKLITSNAVELVRADKCHIFSLQTSQGEQVLIPIATNSQYAEQILQTKLKPGQGVTGRAVQSGVGQIANRVDLKAGSFRVPGTPAEPESLISVPLISGGQVTGALTVSRSGEEEFTERDLQLISALSGHAAKMLENTRLFTEVKQRSQELSALNAVANTASQSLTLQEILDSTLDRIAGVMPGSASLISLRNPTSGELEFTFQRDLPESLTSSLQERDLQGALYEVTANKGQIYSIPDLTQDAVIETEHLVQAGLRALLCTPLIAKGEIIGILSVFGTEPNIFSAADVSLLTAIGQQIGVAVRNAQLYQQTERALAESKSLYEASQAITSTLKLEDVLQIVVNYMADYVSADQCRVVIFDEQAGYGEIKAEYRPTPGIENVRIPMEGNPSYEILRDTGQAIAIEDIHTHPIMSEVAKTMAELGIKSMLLVPLIAGGRLIGSVGLDTIQDQHTFTESEINFCRALADRAALALENRSLFAQTQKALRETTMLYQASNALNQAQDLQDVLRAILDNLPIKEIDQCLIAMMNLDTAPISPEVEIEAMWDHEGDMSLLEKSFTSRELPLITQSDADKIFVISDIEAETELDDQSIATLREIGVKSALIVPLMTSGMCLGWLLLITHHQSRLFTPDQVRPYQALADQAAAAIQNQHLIRQIQASLEEVEAVHRQYLRDEWSSFLELQETQQTNIVYDQETLVAAQDLWHPLIGAAIDSGAPVAHPNVDETRSPFMSRFASDGSAQSSEAAQETPEQTGASLIAPLKVRGQVIGALGLEDPDGDATREWTLDQVSMVQEIADQVALAIENARLLDRTQASLAETARLYEATARLSNPQSADEVVKVLAKEIHATLGAAFSGNIMLTGPDPSGRIEWLELNVQWDATQGVTSVHSRLPSSAYPTMSRFIGQTEPAIITDTQSHPQDEQIKELLTRLQIRTISIIPLVSGDSWLGMINITSREERTPDERAIRFLQSLADRTAVALESIRLHEETQRHAIQLEAASKISRAATSILEQDKLLSSVVELIRDHFNYYHAQVFLLDPSKRWAVLEASTGEIGKRLLQRGHALEVGGPSLIGQVTGSGEPSIAYDVSDDSMHFQNDLLPDTRSEMAIPLRIGGRVIGALDVQSTEPVAFNPDDLSVLSTLADQLATAIENARLYQEQLETAEKLREVDRLKSQFLANMSHELRTPLNSIIGFSRVILKGIDGPVTDMQKQDLTAIYNSGQHLLRLINNILDLSKIEAGKMDLSFEEVDLREIIKSAISATTALVKDRPELELRQIVDPDLPLIMADATRVNQVLLNLLSNAVKFSEKGYVELSATYDAHFVTIKVSDTGMGIPADKFDLIFQEFEQVDGSTTRAIGGTGLGLPISRHFVQMHGGRIWVESELGVGSTFTVKLPIQGPQAVEEVEDLPSDSDQRLILSVDDDDSVIRLYKRYLEKQDYQVVGLAENENVVQKARELCPYAILLDLLMPEKDGWTVIRELKAEPETQNIPVIICSIVSDTGHGFSLGAADYLVKPILEEQLQAALARLEDSLDREPGKSRRVLIIDDTAEDRYLLRRALELDAKGYQILEASGGLEGIQAIQQEQPDLVVLDLMMPEMDGFAVLETLKSDKDTRQIPIIIVTAKELTEKERTQINGQVAALFQKGLFKEDELLQDVDYALRRVRKYMQEESKKEE
jgi:GAF domain-containing protein/DNA-binding response OmpR family regulator